MHASVDSLVVCCPLSLIPQLKRTTEQTVEGNLQAIQDIDMTKDLTELNLKDPECKELNQKVREKLSTRQKLLSINLSLKSLVNLKLGDAMPSLVLRPPTGTEKRCYTNGEPKKAYYWDVSTKQTTWQTTDYANFPKHVRLCALADEGDHSAALCLAEAGCAILAHRDCQHKLAREECLCIADVPQMDVCLRETMLVLRHDAAPWKQGMFGRRLREAYAYVNQLSPDHLLIQLVQAGIIQERGLDVHTTPAEVKEVLCEHARSQGRGGGDHKLGRWSDFVDTFGRERKNWSVKLFFLLFAKSLEGLNPFTAIAQASAADDNDESMPIGPRVLRVSWLSNQICKALDVWFTTTDY